MKKFFTAVLCASMVLGITGCGQSDASDKRSSKDVKKEKISVKDKMAEFDYDLRFRKDTGGVDHEAYFKNDKTGIVFSYGKYIKEKLQDEGMLFQYEEHTLATGNGKVYYAGDKNPEDTLSLDDMVTAFNKELKKIDCSEKEIKDYLIMQIEEYTNKVSREE